MFDKCSAKQIVDFVALWGTIGTFPELCEYAEDAQNLKSLDLIISTLDVFVQAFGSRFINICCKYNENFPFSEEKFIEFLKPRCLLLTKDNKCFNFMLVCAFVYEIILSFSLFNECFHLVKPASKCLTAILKNRFKRIFDSDSGWKELMSFCIKIHSLVYPPENVCQSKGDKFTGITIDCVNTSFPSISQGQDLSVEKHATNDNNDYDTKMSGKEANISLTKDLTTETEEKELEDLNSSESSSSTDAPHTLYLTGEDSSKKSEKIRKKNNTREDNDKNFTKNSLLPVLSVNSVVTEHLDQIICPKENLTISFDDYSALKKVTERLKDFRNSGFPSTDVPDILQLKIEDFSQKRAEDKNENNATADIISLDESTKQIADTGSEKLTTNITKEDNEKLDQMTDLKELIISFDDYLTMKKAIERIENLCNFGLSSTDSSKALQLKIEDLSSTEAQNKEKAHNGTDEREDDKKDCAADMTNSLHELTKEFTNKVSGKPAVENNEKVNESTGFKKSLTLSFEDYLVIKQLTESLEHLSNLGLHSTIPSYMDSLPKEENICIENDVIGINEDCVIVDSSISDLAQDITNTVNNEDGNTEKIDQITGFQENLVILFEKDLPIEKELEISHLCNFEYESSTFASYTVQSKCENFYPNAELNNKGKGFDRDNTEYSNVNPIYSSPPDLQLELGKISIEKKSTKKNVKQKPGKVSCRKIPSLPLCENSSAQKATKKLEGMHNFESSYSSALQHTLKELSSENESKDNKEPFNIRHRSEEHEIRVRITENPQHLLEIMDLLKKCEEDVEPNIFSPDEDDIPMNDSDEDDELEASGGTSTGSSIGVETIFEPSIESTKVFAKNMKMAYSERISDEDGQSDYETLPKTTEGVSPHELNIEFSNRTFQFEDFRCSSCANGMVNFIDTCVLKFAKSYSNNIDVSDYFRFNFYEDSERKGF